MQVTFGFPTVTMVISPKQDPIDQQGLIDQRVLINDFRSYSTSSMLVKGMSSIH